MATTFSWTDNGETVSVIMDATAGNIYATGASIDAVFPACTGRSTSNTYTGQRKFKLLLEENGLEFETPYSAVISGSGTKSATIPASRAKTTNDLFNASNRTTRTRTFTYTVSAFMTWVGDGDNYYWPSSPKTIYTATVILDVPPTVSLGTPTYATPQYAGVGIYTVPITSASAAYGGRISKVTLTVGQDSTVQTYSSSSISNQTISVTPTVAGTYTPTLTVEDSRGQTTTETLADITVNPYLNPSLDFDVFRSNSSGVRDDEGAYGLVTANVSFTDAIADLTQPTVKINGTTTNNVTWYSAYSSSTGVSSVISDWTAISSGATIYGLINGSFNQTDSYSITVSLTDSLGGNSAEITQTLSTAFYTIDFQAGGKEIAFGAPANDDITDFNGSDYSTEGLFKCEMGTAFNDMSAAEVSAFVAGLNYSGVVAVDYIVEQGTNYRKWNSGKAECWGSKTETLNITTAANNSYYTTTSFTFPITFTATPNIFPSLSQDSGVFWASLGNTSTLSTTGCQLRIMSGASQSNKSITWHYYAIGTWK